jgi:hypothetical protein
MLEVYDGGSRSDNFLSTETEVNKTDLDCKTNVTNDFAPSLLIILYAAVENIIIQTSLIRPLFNLSHDFINRKRGSDEEPMANEKSSKRRLSI